MIERWAELEANSGKGANEVERIGSESDLAYFLAERSAKLRRVVEAAKKVCSNYLTGLPDDDPRKGAGNYLADALEELER